MGLVLTVLCQMCIADASTADDYARAERFESYNTTPLVLHSIQCQTWLPDGEFAYRTTTARGTELIVVEPTRGTRRPLLDQSRLQGCDTTQPDGARSPDGKRIAFIRDYNLWVRTLQSGAEVQLTTDGIEGFGYATDNPGWAPSNRPIVTWSPNSSKIATFQADERSLRRTYLVKTQGPPELETWRYALPGDPNVTTIQRVIIDVERKNVIRLDVPPDPYRSTGGALWGLRDAKDEMADVQWSPDASHLAFVSTTRDHKIARFRIAAAATGAVREVFEERVLSGYYSSTLGGFGTGRHSNWRYLPASNQVIWFSSRDNWAHLYLYDASTGKLERQITRGEWDVCDLVAIDEHKREIYLRGVGHEVGRHPYFLHLYKIRFDGRGLQLLTPEDATHNVSLSPSGAYFVDTYSTPANPAVTVLRRTDGKKIAELESEDISHLQAIGWRPPVPITVKARDGTTDLYGLMYSPSHLDPHKKYPIADVIYPGPFLGSVSRWDFTVSRDTNVVGDAGAFAELGFVVVMINGMGTPPRSRQFREFAYGDLGDATLPDQVAGLKELAQRYAWIDIDRAGIMGQSAGGYAAARAMFLYPDFFKVGVAVSSASDPRTYFDQWGEMYMGLLERHPDGTSNYDSAANQPLAGNLRGHLLLIHGTTDANAAPYQTFLMVNALIEANKNFDLLLLPNQRHVLTDAPRLYAMRRSWDYFVRHLLGAEPPDEYAFHVPP